MKFAAVLTITLLALGSHLFAAATSAGKPPVTFAEHIAPVVFQNCTTCHLKVHGSNVNKFLLR